MSKKKIDYKYNAKIDILDLEKLYKDAGWVNYTSDLLKLKRAYEKSVFVVSAWDGCILVGVIRVVGDEETIMYIQDIIVLKKYQRQGIGRKLINSTLEQYDNVRQIGLLTDETQKTVSFYESLGFEKCQSIGLVSFIRLKKI